MVLLQRPEKKSTGVTPSQAQAIQTVNESAEQGGEAPTIPKGTIKGFIGETLKEIFVPDAVKKNIKKRQEALDN